MQSPFLSSRIDASMIQSLCRVFLVDLWDQNSRLQSRDSAAVSIFQPQVKFLTLFVTVVLGELVAQSQGAFTASPGGLYE